MSSRQNGGSDDHRHRYRYRYRWTTPFPTWVNVVGLLVCASGYGASVWALVESRLFTSMVRIQTERGHQVCDSGPWRFVRNRGCDARGGTQRLTAARRDRGRCSCPPALAVGDQAGDQADADERRSIAASPERSCAAGRHRGGCGAMGALVRLKARSIPVAWI